MCLIAYIPAGKSLTRDVFDTAHKVNSDGIGVMSIKGVQKFFGSKALKRARQYVDGIAKEGLAHAVHWRYATHGSRGLALCHPFKLPNVDAYLMHNGVIGSTAQDAGDDASDTLLYVNKLVDAPTDSANLDFWNKICHDIGDSNKGCVMYPDGHFILLNKDKGFEKDGIWYSNQYSLPDAMREYGNSHFVPSRLRLTPNYRRWEPSNYYESETANWGGTFGSVIYWSSQHAAYGFWEGNLFTKLVVSKAEPIPEPEPKRIDFADASRCPRCSRLKEKTLHHLQCWCDDTTLADWYKQQGLKPPLPSGPTLDSDETHKSVPQSHAGPCEHGVTSWEDCRECINRLEYGDCRLPRDNGGWDDETNTTNDIIFLPRRLDDAT